MKTIKELITNKKVVFYGDSLTHNWEKYDHDLNLTHPEDENYQYGLGYNHVKMLNDICNFKSVHNFAVSGGCYANTYYLNKLRPVWRHGPHQIMHSLKELSEAEVIFVMLGSNDFAEQVKFGHYKDCATSFDQDDMTFHEGMNFVFSKIKEVNPTATVFILNILTRAVGPDAHATFNFSTNEYNLAIAHVCKEYGYNLVDVTSVVKLEENFVGGTGTLYSEDGLHLNEDGYKAFTNFLLNYQID